MHKGVWWFFFFSLWVFLVGVSFQGSIYDEGVWFSPGLEKVVLEKDSPEKASLVEAPEVILFDRQSILARKDFIKEFGEDVMVSGVLEARHVDDFFNKEFETQYFFIDDIGERKRVYFEEGDSGFIGFISGTRLSINGKLLSSAGESEIAVSGFEVLGNGGTRALGAEVNPVLGEQRIAVILLKNESTTWDPYTHEEIYDAIFNISNPLSLNNYISENSFGQTWLTGEIYGWYTAIPNTGILIADDDVNFTLYERVIKLEYSQVCCGVANIFPVPYFTNDGWVNLSVAVNTAIDEFGLDGSDSLRFTAHEFGHTFGLGHANYYSCSEGSTQGVCSSIEYGDIFDLMGAGGIPYSHFNAHHKEVVGWINEVYEIRQITQDGVYTVYPLESAQPGIKALKIRKDDSLNYVIDFRRRIGHDSSIPQERNLEGAFIYLDGYPNYSIPEYSNLFTNLIDFSPRGPNFFGDTVIPLGHSFTEPASGFTVTTLEVTDNYLRVNISLAECRDGIDNDGDGLIDYPNDPGCDSPSDNTESPFQQIFFEDCADLSDWTLESSSSDTWFSQGGLFCRTDSSVASSTNMTSSVINLGNVGEATLSFDYSITTDIESVYLRIYADDGNGFTMISEYNTGIEITRQTFALGDFITLTDNVKLRAECESIDGVCTLDNINITSFTQNLPVCGDGIIGGSEQCDNEANNGIQCTPNYGSSCDYCSGDCQIVIVQGGFCGNSVIETGEQCDINNFNNRTCVTEGFNGGDLSCRSPGSPQECQFYILGCEFCGNEVIDSGEECDGSDLNGQTCRLIRGYGYGTLSCSSSCSFDLSRCNDNEFAQGSVGVREVEGGPGLLKDRPVILSPQSVWDRIKGFFGFG